MQIGKSDIKSKKDKLAEKKNHKKKLNFSLIHLKIRMHFLYNKNYSKMSMKIKIQELTN